MEREQKVMHIILSIPSPISSRSCLKGLSEKDYNTKFHEKEKPSAGISYFLTEGFYVYRLNKSFMPSISKARVKRRVWSRGLLWAVEMT